MLNQLTKGINATLESINGLFSRIAFVPIQVVTWKYFPYAVMLFFVLAFCLWLFRAHRKWNQEWLSVQIESKISNPNPSMVPDQQKKYNLKLEWRSVSRIFDFVKLGIIELWDGIRVYFKRSVRYDIKNWHLPSATWLVILFVGAILFFILSHEGVPYRSVLSIQKWSPFLRGQVTTPELSNIIAVLTGLVSIVFALVIFLAESIRESKNPEQKKVLLRVSGLWFLVTLTTLSLLNFLWFKVTVLSLLLPVVITFGIIYSFWRVIHVLVNPEAWEESRVKLVKERMKRIILDSVRERIGNSILLNRIGKDKEIKIEYTFSTSWIVRGAQDYFFIESVDEGWLSDINLAELFKLVQHLENNARQLGFSLYLDTAPSVNEGVESEVVGQSQLKKGRVKKVYLLKRFGERLPPNSIFTDDSKVILALPKEFEDIPGLIDYVRSLIPHIFRFKKTEPPSNIFRRELQGTKDQLVAAIRSTSLGSVEKLKETYLDLAETFLETIHEFGGGFSAEQAQKERGNIFEGWNEVRWLTSDIRELLIVASDTGNRDVISDVAFLPIAIAIRAVQAKDHFLFQEFLAFPSFLFFLSQDKPDSNLKSFMVERSWRYLKELSDFYIESPLKDRDNEASGDDLKEYKDFALYTYKTFQDLLKSAFDYKDIDSFRVMLQEFSRLYHSFDPKNDHPNVDFLEHNLNWNITEAEKEEIRKKLIAQKTKEEIAKEIQLAKEQVLFGIGSKIFQKYRQDQQDGVLKEFFTEIVKRLPEDIVHLTELFDSTRSFKVEDYWGWDRWEMISDGEVHTIDVHSKLDRLYCVKALQILGALSEETIDKFILPHSRDLAFLSEERAGSDGLLVILEDIQSNQAQWSFVLDDTQRSKAPSLKKLLQQAKKAQEESEVEFLKNAPIDPDRLQKFKEELREGSSQSGHLRSVAVKLGIYRDLTDQVPGTQIPSWGYNQIDDKAALVKDWHVHYGGWGEQYGRGMADSEDQVVFEEIIKGIKDSKEVVKQDIIKEVEKAIFEKSLTEPIVLQSLEHLNEFEQIRNSEAFVPHYDSRCPKTIFDGLNGYLGVLNVGGKAVPVIDVFVRKGELKDKVIVGDLDKFGTWDQYSPVDKAEDEVYRDGIFSLKIVDLNTDTEARNKLISADPDWLQKREDKEGYLRQRVLINYYQKLKFQIQNPDVIRCLNVKPDTAKETS